MHLGLELVPKDPLNNMTYTFRAVTKDRIDVKLFFTCPNCVSSMSTDLLMSKGKMPSAEYFEETIELPA